MNLKNIFCCFLMIFITVCLSTAFCIVEYGLHDNFQPADVGIIFGNKAHRHHTPSIALAARLKEGLYLYQHGYIKNIIVTGGTDRDGTNEAAVMQSYLISHGIPAKSIFMDPKSKNTWQNAINSKKIMEQQHFKSAIAISQYYHLARCVFVMHRIGVSPVYHAHAPYFAQRDLYTVPREVLAFYYYFLFHHYTL